MSSDTSKVNTRGTCDCWQDKQSHEVNATLVRPLTFITTYISRFSIPIYLTSSIDSPRAYHHDSRLTNMKAECSSGRNASQTSTWISHAGEAIRVTLLCSITAPPPVYSNRQRHPAFTVAIHDQPRTKSTRAAVSHPREQNIDTSNLRAEMPTFTSPHQPITSQLSSPPDPALAMRWREAFFVRSKLTVSTMPFSFL